MKISIIILLICVSIATVFASSLTQRLGNLGGPRKFARHENSVENEKSVPLEGKKSVELLKPVNVKNQKSVESSKATQPFIQRSDLRADTGLSPLGGKCYYYSGGITRDFNGAFNYCLNNNMRLVSLPMQADNDLLSAYLRNAGIKTGQDKIWSSAHKQSCDGSWVWEGINQPVTYTNWNNGEPNNSGGNENCVELFQSGQNNDLVWNDVDCSKAQNFICESSCSRN